jgi:hypothetical protein
VQDEVEVDGAGPRATCRRPSPPATPTSAASPTAPPSRPPRPAATPSAARRRCCSCPGQRAVLLGDGTPLTNDRLDERGNAALALDCSASGRAACCGSCRARPAVQDETSLTDLLPDGLLLGALQLLVRSASWRCGGPVGSDAS